MDLSSLYTTGILVGEAAALLSLIIAGVKFVLSMGFPERIEDAKNQVIASLLGLFIITFLPTILHFANPDLPRDITEIFNPPASQIPEARVTREEQLGGVPGVYATTTQGKEYLLGLSVAEFGPDLNNKIDTITFVDPPGFWYGIILFEEANYKGPCVELTPSDPVVNEGMLELVKASSAMIYTYPEGDPAPGELIFYRKAFYDETGGEYGGTMTPSYTSWLWLEGNKFEDVPEDEKKCLRWNANGECEEKEEPSLAGDGIGSIKIAGNLSILLLSEGKIEKEIGNYYCQLFWDKEGTFSVANLKNEYIRDKKRYPLGLEILPGHP